MVSVETYIVDLLKVLAVNIIKPLKKDIRQKYE